MHSRLRRAFRRPILGPLNQFLWFGSTYFLVSWVFIADLSEPGQALRSGLAFGTVMALITTLSSRFGPRLKARWRRQFPRSSEAPIPLERASDG